MARARSKKAALTTPIQQVMERLVRDRARALDALRQPGAGQVSCGAIYGAAARLVMGAATRLLAQSCGLPWPLDLLRTAEHPPERPAQPILDALGEDTDILERLRPCLPLDQAGGPAEQLGQWYEGLLDLELSCHGPGQWRLERKRATRKGAGAFYTGDPLASPITRLALEPLVFPEARGAPSGGRAARRDPLKPEAILSLTVCDPAMGCGAFVVAALRFLTRALQQSVQIHGRPKGVKPQTSLPRLVAERCLYGVDLDPLAVDLARASLWLEVADPALQPQILARRLCCGNSLVGAWLNSHTQPPVRASQQKEYLDTYCATWFWPEEELSSTPTPHNFQDPPAHTGCLVRKLAAQHRFFHWELAFPEVFSGARPGFDAVVGNPPWEILKPISKEFFSGHDPLYRTFSKQLALKKQQQYFDQCPDLEQRWSRHQARFAALSRWIRRATDHPEGNGPSGTGQPFRLQGSGDLNSYKLFVELALFLTAAGGRCGLIVPSGLYTDKGTMALRQHLLDRCGWTHLYVFQNERFVFREVDHRFKIAVVGVSQSGAGERPGLPLRTRFRLGPADSPAAHELEADITGQGGYLPQAQALIRRLSPHTGVILEIRDARDLAILEQIHRAGVSFKDGLGRTGEIQLRTELHMTAHSQHFPPCEQWEARGFVQSQYDCWLEGGWRPHQGPRSVLRRRPGLVLSADGARAIPLDEIKGVALPLYQGVMIQGLCSNAAAHLGRGNNRARWQQTSHPHQLLRPQFLMSQDRFRDWPGRTPGPRAVFRALSNTTNQRTLVASALDPMPCGNSLTTLSWQRAGAGTDHEATLAAAGLLASLCYDWQIRRRIAGTNINAFFLQDTVWPRLPAAPRRWLAHTVARLCFTSPRHAPHWLDLRKSLGVAAPRPARQELALTPHERARLLAQLDAVVAALYGLGQEDFRWILRDCDRPVQTLADSRSCRGLDTKGFWRVDRHRDPELRHTVLALAAFLDLQRLGGVEAFLCHNGGDGWALPASLRLADLGLGHDERARQSQPVAQRFGPRFLPWQQELSLEQSLEEQQRHAWQLRMLS